MLIFLSLLSKVKRYCLFIVNQTIETEYIQKYRYDNLKN